MSNQIDERVVAIKLKNSQFEANARKTLGTLKDLASALKLDKAASGLSSLAGAARNFRLGNVDEQVNNVSKSFSALSVIGVTALATIANKAVTAGLSLYKSLTMQPMLDGFAEYELKMSSIQTILANTSRYGTTLEEVTKNLDELNEYADKTIYNFGDMTRNIGLFTNAGIGIKDATAMIKGFSNVAAASGTSSQGAASAAYQLSQALSAGTVRLMDWKSLETVGMGNKNMQKDLISIAEAMGTIEESGTTATAVTKDFRGSLKDGWLSADVMSMYLRVMAEDNEKLNRAQLESIGITGKQADAFVEAQKVAQDSATKVRTLTQFFGTLREGIGSSWGETFTIVFGDFEEATKLFTGLSESVGAIFQKMGDNRNKLLQDWVKFGGRQAGIESLKNIFEALSIVIGAVRDAFRDIFPPKTGKDLANMTKSFRDFTENLKMGPENADRLKRIFSGLFAILKVGLTIISGVANTLLGLFGIAQGGSGGFLELAASIGDFVVKIQEWLSTNKRIADFFKTIDTARLTIMVPLVAIIGNVAEALADLFKGDIEGFKQNMREAFQGIGPLVDGIWKSATKAISSYLGKVRDVAGVIGELFKSMGNSTAEKFGKALQFVSEKLGELRDLVQNFGFNAFNKGSQGATTTADALGKAGGKVKDVFESVWKVVGDFFSGIWAEIGPFAKSIMDLFTTISTKLAEFIEGLDFQDAVALLNTGMFIMMFRSITKTMEKAGGMYESFKGLGDKIDDALDTILDTISGTFTSTFKTVQQSLKADILMKIAIAIGIFAASLWVLSRIDPKALIKAVSAVGVLLFMLQKSMSGLLSVMDEFSQDNPLAVLNVVAAGAALMLLSLAVLALSFAVKKLSSLSWEEMAKGLVSVGVIIGALTLFTKYATLDKASAAGNLALIAMAASVLALSIAVEKLAKIDTNKLIQGTSAIVILVATMTAMSNMLAAKGPTGTLGLIAMAFAISLLVAPITALGMLPVDKLNQGLKALAIAMTLLTISALLMANPMIPVAASGMILIAAALNLLIVPITALGLLPMETLSQGMTALGIALGALTLAMLLMANPLALVGGLGLVAIAFGLNLLVAPILLLGSAPWDVVVQGLKAMAIVLGILVVAGMLLIPASVGFALFGAALVLIGVGALATGVGLMLVATAIGILTGVGVAGITLMSLAITTFASLLPVIATQVGMAIRAIVNVIGESGPEMVRAFSAILNSILTAIINNQPKFNKAMDGMIKGLLTIIERNLPQFLRVMDKIIKGMLTIIQRNLPQYLETMGQIISGMLKLIRDKMPEYVATMTAILTGMLQVIRNVAPRFYTVMGEIVMGMVNKIVSLTPRIASAGVTMILRFLTVIQQAVPQIAAKGTDIMIALINAIAREVPRLADAGAKAIIRLVNGVATAIRNNQAAMNAAGRNLASAILSGMTGGLTSGASAVTNAAQNVAKNALNAAKNFLGIRSPSREFKKLGQYSTQGFAIGLKGNSKEIDNAMKTMYNNIKASVKNSSSDIAKYTARLNKLNRARRKDTKDIAKTKAALQEARREYILSRRAQARLGTFGDEANRLKSLSREYDSYTKRLETAKTKLADLKKAQSEYRTTVFNQFSKLPNIAPDTKIKDYINTFEKQIVDNKIFNAQLKKLQSYGLNKKIYEDLVSKGTDAIPFVEQLLDQGKKGVNHLNSLQSALDKSASTVATTASKRLHQAGIDAAEGLVKGLESKRERIKTVMSRIADSMTRQIKRSLGIRSPSKEFAKIGGWSTDGLIKGFEQSSPKLEKASAKVGDDTIETFRKSLSGLSSLVAADMDLDPTIRPVLDLSSIKKDASQIGDIMSGHSVEADASYKNAKIASSDYNRILEIKAVDNRPEGTQITFNQHNNSPKSLSNAEIYRQTKNQISAAKGALKV